jgi:hypothetical protein
MAIPDDFAAALSAYSNIRAFRFDSRATDEICIIPGGGRVDMVSSLDGSGSGDIARPRVQVQIRGADLATVHTRALAIKAALHRGTVANCLAVYWDGRAPDYWMDENGLHVFAVEFVVLREPGE